jgi:2-polyprenyl-6-methoxyphenol hydroxylase-like FAD-dependent oxidoreductase
MSGNHQASLKIKFLIVGGGLAGLACAYALRVSGHETVVVEQRSVKTKVCLHRDNTKMAT